MFGCGSRCPSLAFNVCMSERATRRCLSCRNSTVTRFPHGFLFFPRLCAAQLPNTRKTPPCTRQNCPMRGQEKGVVCGRLGMSFPVFFIRFVVRFCHSRQPAVLSGTILQSTDGGWRLTDGIDGQMAVVGRSPTTLSGRLGASAISDQVQAFRLTRQRVWTEPAAG